MWGYILNLYKYATFPSNIKSDMSDYLNKIATDGKKRSNSPSLLVYGEYDRLSIKKVPNFSRFRDVDDHAQHWLGSRQTILLYQLPFQNYGSSIANGADLLEQFCKSNGDPSKELPGDSENQCGHRNFLIFTMVTLNPDLHNADFNRILERCCGLIQFQIQGSNVQLIEEDAISYQVYGSFSSSELAIVWSVNQYVDAFRLIEVLRHSAFKVDVDGKTETKLPFASFYSIIAQPKRAAGASRPHKPIHGSAELRLVFQDGIKDEDYKKCKEYFARVLKDEDGGPGEDTVCKENPPRKDCQLPCCEKHSVGEYDYSISVPANILCDPYRRIFCRGEPLHWANEHMHQYISSSCVQLYYDIAFTDADLSFGINTIKCPELNNINISSLEGEKLRDKILLIKKMTYGPDKEKTSDLGGSGDSSNEDDLLADYRTNGLRPIIKKKIPETVGLCDSLDLLYTDFLNNCTNLTSTAWARDLVTQFIAIIDYIANEFYFNYEANPSIENLFSRIKNICEIYIQMIYHIAQSRRTVFVVPSCHLRYMGQYDMILHAYYGWEKYLLELAYTFPHENGVQPVLIPVITIDVVPEICVNNYKIKVHYDPEERISNIFSINMPLGAMTDFLRYALIMCHETAHLIIPRDRDRRNQVFGMLFFSEFIANMLLSSKRNDLMQSGSEDDASIIAYIFPFLERAFMAAIFNKFRDFFLVKLHNPIMTGYRESPDSYPPWQEYRVLLKNQLTHLLSEDFDSLVIQINRVHPVFHELVLQILGDYIVECMTLPSVPAGIMRMKKESRDTLKEDLLARLDFSSPVAGQTVKNDFEEILNKRRGDVCNYSSVMGEAYREACQDLLMIRVFQLELVDYLVIMDRHRRDTVTLEAAPPTAEMLRIAMICDYLIAKNDLSESQLPHPVFALQKFCNYEKDYVDLFVNLPEIRTKDAKLKARITKQTQEHFGKKRTWLHIYYDSYGAFRPLMLEQLKNADPFLYSDEMRDGLMANGMKGFYKEWKDAILSDATEDEVNSRIFSNNIAMIQRYQRQDTFETIASKLVGSDGKQRNV